jgi:pantetheine-phosphate adenylyltransferase
MALVSVPDSLVFWSTFLVTHEKSMSPSPARAMHGGRESTTHAMKVPRGFIPAIYLGQRRSIVKVGRGAQKAQCTGPHREEASGTAASRRPAAPQKDCALRIERLIACFHRLRFFTMRRAIYPGSFDPVTNGHLDVIQRASQLFDEVVVAVAFNDAKHPLFTARERTDMLKRVVNQIPNVTVASFGGLLMQFAREREACVVVRGLRAVSDFEFEFQMALMNRKLEPKIETVFLTPKEEYTYLSSRIVKEIARLGGDVVDFVPAIVAKGLRKKFSSTRGKNGQP